MDTVYRSYALQTVHYFDRPHTGVPTAPIDSAAAWSGADFADPQTWQTRVRPDVIQAIETGLDVAANSGKPMSAWTVEDVPFEGLTNVVSSWRREIAHGRGFLLLRGFPVARWGEDRSAAFFWALGLHLGVPGAQNPQGDLLGHVEDTGDDQDDPQVRLYRTSADIAYHCDAADAVGLLCLSPSRSGGASRIASSVAVWNELLARDPALAARLFEPVRLDLRNEERPGMRPWIEVVPCRFADGSLRTFYHSDYFRSVERHAAAVPFTELERALFDAYEEIAETPGIFLDMELEAGDVQLISNHTILHARTGYEDSEDSKRHLLRLWLSFETDN